MPPRGPVLEFAADPGARLAQLVEHQLDTLGVASSSLAPRTIFLVKPRLARGRDT